MNLENEVEIHGYEDGFSVIALKMLLLVLRTKDVLDYFMERTGSAGFYRAYYQRNAKKRQRDYARNIREKYGISVAEYRRRYYGKHRDRILEQVRKSNARARKWRIGDE